MNSNKLKQSDTEPAERLPRARGWAGWKSALTLLAVTVAFYWKIILVHQYSLLLGYEGVDQAYAWLNFWISTVRRGIWPIWDPFTFSGHAFAGEMQTGAFYPLYAVFLAIPFHHGVFSPQAYHIFYALTHFLCAWFTYLLARELAMSPFAALVSGICFSLGGILGRLPEWPHLLQSGIWMPLIFLLLLRALNSSQLKGALAFSGLCGLSIAMAILAGGLHMVIMELIVVVSACVFYAATSSRIRSHSRALSPGPAWPGPAWPGSEWIRCSTVALCSAGVAIAGGAVQLLPSMEYSRLALRFSGGVVLPATQKIPYNYLVDALWPHSFLGLLIPAFAGSPGSGEYLSPYLGVLPLLLAVVGAWRRWDCLWVRYLSGLVIAACLYSIGSFSFLHGILYAITPFLWLAREADRFMFLADFGIALLAGFGLDVLFSHVPSGSWAAFNNVLKWIAVASLAALFYPFVLGKGDLGAWISFSLLLILLTYGLYRYIAGGNRGQWARFLVIALIIFDLGGFNWTEANKITVGAQGHDEMSRLLSLRGAVDFLGSRPRPFRTEWAIDFAPNIGDMFGVEETGGTGVTLQIDYSKLKSHADLLNTRYVIRAATATEPGPIYADSSWKIYEKPNAYPRAWLVHETAIEPDADKLFQRLDGGKPDLHRAALLAAPLQASLDQPSNLNDERVVWLSSRQDQVRVDVHAGGRALLVFSELFYPGWRATVNGRAAQILKVDGGLRGVVVPGGDSHVALDYLPNSFLTGLAFTLAAFLGTGFFAFQLYRERRRAWAILQSR